MAYPEDKKRMKVFYKVIEKDEIGFDLPLI
jgi:hypothetical protein